MAPINCTSKWRIFSTRLLASRQTANASGRISSSVLPAATRCLNSAVLACSSASDNFSIVASKALMSRAFFLYCLSSRWLRLPKIWVSNDMLGF